MLFRVSKYDHPYCINKISMLLMCLTHQFTFSDNGISHFIIQNDIEML